MRTTTVRTWELVHARRYAGPAALADGTEVEVTLLRQGDDAGVDLDEAADTVRWVATDHLHLPMTREVWEDEQACRGDYEREQGRDREFAETLGGNVVGLLLVSGVAYQISDLLWLVLS